MVYGKPALGSRMILLSALPMVGMRGVNLDKAQQEEAAYVVSPSWWESKFYRGAQLHKTAQ